MECPTNMKDPVCAAYNDYGYFKRMCLSRDDYNKNAKWCENGTCVIGICEESGCSAELPAPGIHDRQI